MLKKTSAVIALVVGLVIPRGTTAGVGIGQDPRFDRVATSVEQKMKEYGVPGVSLAILREGNVTSRPFGVTSVDNALPVTADTLFQIGSITKTFTGTLVMRLVDEGKLQLDSPVRTYIPDFRVKDADATRLATVRTLLTHMGGWEGDLFIDTGDGDDALAKAVARMADSEQVAPIGTIWSYNNAGFFVAARLVEIATHRPYESALNDLLIRPLGLKAFVFPADVMTYRFAVGHGGPIDKPGVLRPWRLPRAVNGVGSIVTTAADLLRYAQFHLGDGTANGTRVMSADGLERLQATQFVKQGTDDEMGLTWHISNEGGVRRISHGGSTTGQQALLEFIPARRFAIAILTNGSRGGQLARDVTRAALHEYLDVTVTDPAPIDSPAADLQSIVGRYTRPYADVVIARDGPHVTIQTIQKKGFPSEDVPPRPPSPAAPFAFYAKDRLIGTAGETKLAHAEIIRRADGTIGWIR